MDKILVIDYGVGNLASVTNMIDHAGGKFVVGSNKEMLNDFSKVILPGVGRFDYGIKSLGDLDMIDLLRQKVIHKEIKILGICLGMQLLCHSSEEGILPGFRLINAKVCKFKSESGIKVPHMGWNELSINPSSNLFKNMSPNPRFYFVHSYFVETMDPRICVSTSFYGSKFCAGFEYDNIFGVQFHPEKSHKFGIELFRNFIQI